MLAVQSLRKYSGCGGLAGSAGSAEYVGMVDATRFYGVLKDPDNVVLADQFFKGLWSVSSC